MYTEDQVRNILSSIGVGIENETVNNFIVFCPFHNNFRTPAAEIDHESGIFYCFSCKHTCRLEEFVVRSGDINYFQAVRLIDKYRVPTSIVDEVDNLLAPPDEINFDGAIVDEMHAQALKSQRAVDYFKKRNIEYDSVLRYKLGYSSNLDMITLPFMTPMGDRYMGMEGRSIEGKRFLAAGQKSKALFNLSRHMWADSVFLTESTLDCIRMEQVGARAISSMGSNRSRVQIDLLKRYFNTIYIVADNDDAKNDYAGQVSAQKVVDKLGGSGIMVVPPTRYKDIGEMPDEEIKALVESVNDIGEI